MRSPWKQDTSVVQPPFFGVPALAVTLQGLVDLDASSIVFGVQTVDPINDTLCALWVSSPVLLDRHLKIMHEAHSEFLKQLWEATGPFSGA